MYFANREHGDGAVGLQSKRSTRSSVQHITMWIFRLKGAFPFMLWGVLLARAQLFEQFTPFALAFFATVFTLKKPYVWQVVFAILVGSMLTSEPRMWEVIGEMCLFAAAYVILAKNKCDYLISVPSIVAGIIFTVRCTSDFLNHGLQWNDIWSGFLESLLAFFITLICIQAVLAIMHRRSSYLLMSDKIAAVVLFFAFASLGILGWDIGPLTTIGIMMSYVIILFSFVGGAPVGAFVGLLCGLYLSLHDQHAIYQMSLFAFSGMWAGFIKRNRVTSILSYICSSTLFMLYFGNGAELWRWAGEVVIASVLILFTPKLYLYQLTRNFIFQKEEGNFQHAYNLHVKDATLERLLKFSKMFKQILMKFQMDQHDQKLMHEQSKAYESIQPFKRYLAESRELIHHKLSGICTLMDDLCKEFDQEASQTYGQITRLREELECRGIYIAHVHLFDLKEGHIRMEIIHSNSSKQNVSRSIMSPILSEVFDEHICVTNSVPCDNSYTLHKSIFESVRVYEIGSGVATFAIDGDLLSGDSFLTSELGNGKYAVALSDGMGSGVRARRESSRALELLQQLLKTGMNELTAVRTLNSMMVLSSMEDMYTTLDMALINLYNAKTTFVKTGCTPSFIKRDQQVITISANNLPVGIVHDVDVELITIPLQANDLLIMMSDGIYDSMGYGMNKELSIKNKILDIHTTDPQEFAECLLDAYCHDDHIQDDMTVMVTKVSRHQARWATIGKTKTSQIDISQSVC